MLKPNHTQRLASTIYDYEGDFAAFDHANNEFDHLSEAEQMEVWNYAVDHGFAATTHLEDYV